MIIKTTDEKKPQNKFEKAGIAAEMQMAHYLKRALEKEENIYVINDLRLERDSEVAQIDHLILHKYGIVIAESKSVTGKVSINKHAEWKRIYGHQESGMPSPIEQGKRQMTFLIEYLNLHRENLFHQGIASKLLGTLKFEQLNNRVLVAISDQGIIERHIELPEVLKADRIPDTIKEIITDLRRKSNNPLGKIIYELRDDTLLKIAKFLTRSHKPSNKTKQESYSSKNYSDVVNEPKSAYQKHNQPATPKLPFCSKCNSTDLEIQYGKYGYYFKCRSCQGNTRIHLSHKTPECKIRLKKEKKHFYKICSTCNTNELFFVNP